MCATVYVENSCGIVGHYLYDTALEEMLENSKSLVNRQEFEEIYMQMAFLLCPMSVCRQLVDMRPPTCWTGVRGYLYFWC